MSQGQKGFQKDRLIDKTDNFDCNICFLLAADPLECLGCGQIYCKECQDSWKNECGCYSCVRCDGSTMHALNEHLMEIYNKLKYQCQCNQIFSMQDIKQHQIYCNQPNCKHSTLCYKKASPQFGKQQVCSTSCLILELTQQNIKDQNKLYKLIMAALHKNVPINPNSNDICPLSQKKLNIPNVQIVQKQQSLNNNNKQEPNIPLVPFIQIKNNFPNVNVNQVQFRWDKNNKGENIEIQNDGYKVVLKESQYVFKSVVSDIPFEKGQHYFELVLESFTENELKIGVVTNNTFNKNSAFCDAESGFGYYTVGKLRNGSNAHGSDYGQKFKNNGVCGVFLDMNKGVIIFSYNGISQGIAFKSQALTKAPIYASVALLHCAGFTLKSGLPIPAWAVNAV